MNAAAIRRSERDIRRTTLWYGLGMVLYAVVIGLFYPTVRDSAEDFDELLDQYPEALLRAFGIGEDFSLSDYGTFVSAEYLGPIWPIAAGVFIIMAAASVVAREIETGTVDIWLSVPASRWELLLAKLIVLCGACLLLASATMISVGLTGVAVGAEVDSAGLVGATLVMFAFTIVLGGIAATLSSLFNERGRAAGLAAALALTFYAVSIVAELSEPWRWLRYLTIFAAYVPDRALSGGRFPLAEFAILCAIGLAGGAASLMIFQRRDITA